jgi:sugar transferase (PEP-CTERM system associated)
MIRIGGQKVSTQTLLLLIADMILVVFGLLVATLVRFQDFHTSLHYVSSMQTAGRFGLVVLTCGLSLHYYDLYDGRIVRQHGELFVRLLQALGTVCLALAIFYYLIPGLGLGRGIAVLAAPTILLLAVGSRLALEDTSLLAGDPERVLVLGTAPAGISLVREIIGRPDLRMKVVGFLDEKGENIGKPLVNPGIIGACSDVEKIVMREKIDKVVISLTERRGYMPVRELLDLKFAGVSVESADTTHEKIFGRIFLERLSPSWLILSDGFRKSWFLLLVKRAIDIVASLLASIVFLPIAAVVAAAIWIEDGSPILFRQERVGLKGRKFDILKFRSMFKNAEENGPIWASTDDRRTTRVGRIIRQFRLDELPQLINVLRGEMSLVGPRPERPVFCQMLEENVPLFSQRHTARPGVTGWAQIKYKYGGSIEEAKTKLEYDLFYIKHLSITLDLLILFETAKVMITGRGAK